MTPTMDAEPNDDPIGESADSPARADSTDDDTDDTDDDTTHLDDLPDGAGCAEVWEHLSEGRDGD